MRNNIAQYEDNSPLFGFLRYRRRNVIIKYLPEDTSRLIQGALTAVAARVTVHFNAVCERFAPYNTTFSIAAAKELKDTKLSAACSLHAASGSISSSTSSLRRRRLMEIAEEEEEEQRASKRQSVVHEDDTAPNEDDPSDASTTPKTPAPVPPVTLNADLASSPEEREFSPSSEPPDFVGVARPSSPTKSIDEGDRRMSSQTARPDLYSYSSYTYGKPKVKLGPRPSLDVSGRPKTAGTFRPVSQMPAGFKSRSYSKDGKRKKLSDGNEAELVEHDDELADIATAASIPLPETSPTATHDTMRPHTSSGRPTTSSGASMKSPIMSTFSSSVKQTMTPEKARLMKAMQMREKRKQMSLQPAAVPIPDSPVEDLDEGAQQEEVAAEPDKTPTSPTDSEKQLSMVKLDSGITVDTSAASMQTDPSESTRSDSRPTSPLVPSSEPEQSTKASSLSESTDETVRESHVEKGTDEANSVDLGESSESNAAATIEALTPESSDDDELKDDSIIAVPTAVAASKSEGEVLESTAENAKPLEAVPRDVTAKEELGTPLTPPVSKFSSHSPIAPANLPSPSESKAPPETPTSPPKSPSLAIPTSRFSSREASSPRSPTLELPTIVPPFEDSALLKSTPKGTDTDVKAEAVAAQTRQAKRKTIEPIRTDLDTPDIRSEAHLSDDESLMDELQSATVEQAQHMSVSKSPITPVFPSPQRHATTAGNSSTKGSPRSVVRTISNPIRGNLLTPTDVSQSSARSFSSGAAYLHKITQQQSGNQHLAPKTGKMGSKISQRIKALEQLSGSSASGEASSRVNAPSAQFFSVRKPSTREPSRSPSVVDRATSLTRNKGSPPSTAISDSRDASPEMRVRRERSTSVASRLSMFEGPIIPSPDSMPRGRPESISVTARIVRDPSQLGASLEPPKDPAEFGRLEFKVSPLEVNHQRAELKSAPVIASKETIQERRMSREKRLSQSHDDDDEGKPRRSSLSIVKDFIKERRKSLSTSTNELSTASTPLSPRPPSTHHNSGFPRRLSISSRRSSISKDAAAGAMSPSMFTETSGSGDDSKSMSSDKKKSRAGRFMRRLSSSLSASRGKVLSPTTISPTVQEETLADTMAARGVSRGSSQQQSAVTAYLGDVNVQFPDNLLWKRRTMCLDSQGFLILSATAAPSVHKGKTGGVGVKRYHLSDFRNPYTPDVEVQELPNSVVLDFVDGSSLQIACEDRAGQLGVLHTLQEAHQAHSSFGQ
ncbi:hypothetical protein ACHAQA_009995 [Verticillium albo-atrum]